MLSRKVSAKALNSCRRRVGSNFKLKEKRMNRIIRVLGMRQFNCEAALRYNKALEEYKYKVRQEVPCRAMYFFYNQRHEERRTGYVLAYGNNGRKWFARKRDADAAMHAMIEAGL